jgi:prefoldin subunit 5
MSRLKRKRRQRTREHLELRKIRKAANRAKREAARREKLVKAKRELQLAENRLAKAKAQLGGGGGVRAIQSIGKAVKTIRKVQRGIAKSQKKMRMPFGD